MKILHVISSLELGGAQRLLADLLPIMAEQHDVFLLVNVNVNNELTSKLENAGVHIIAMNQPNLYSVANVWKIVRVMKEVDMDIVHVHLFPTVYWTALASLFVRVKLIFTEHSTSNKRRGKWYFRPVERFMYGRYDRIVSISSAVQEALVVWLKAKNDDPRFIVVNNGIDLLRFQAHKESTVIESERNLVMVSRFVPSKDHQTVIRAMLDIPADVHLFFIGDGETMKECQELVKQLSLEKRIHFLGRQEDIKPWLSKAYLGIQSSKWEGFGLTAVEMMAAGLPVIASDVNGLKQVVEGAGELFEGGNSKTLATIVCKILNDRDLYKEIQQRCILRAKQFDINKTCETYLTCYKNCCNEETNYSGE